METYKLVKAPWEQTATSVLRLPDSASIPCDPANTDFVQFKKDVLEGAELQDADGNVMTQEEAVVFINELP